MANVDYFTDWSHEAIDVWLACAFEHTGELDVRAAGVVLTVSGDPLVIGALRARFDVGEVTERLERRPIADWRLTKPDELRAILWTIQPYLTTTAEAVRQALEKMDKIQVRERQRRQRHHEIVALWLEDRSKASIAQALGVSYPVVTEAIERFKSGPVPPSEFARTRKSSAKL